MNRCSVKRQKELIGSFLCDPLMSRDKSFPMSRDKRKRSDLAGTHDPLMSRDKLKRSYWLVLI